MNKVAKLARKLAEEAVKSRLVKVGIVMLQDNDGEMHKTEFGFNSETVEETVVVVEGVEEVEEVTLVLEPPQEAENPTVEENV